MGQLPHVAVVLKDSDKLTLFCCTEDKTQKKENACAKIKSLKCTPRALYIFSKNVHIALFMFSKNVHIAPCMFSKNLHISPSICFQKTTKNPA